MSENNSENCKENRQLSPLKTDENDKICWSPRFEFDAPRYTNFTAKKFKETRRLLNKLVLNQEEETEEEEKEESLEEQVNNNINSNSNSVQFSCDESDSEAEFNDLISFTLREDSDSSDIDEWFNRFHPLHEPLRPMTPPGPLISPEKLFVFKPQTSLKASPLKLDSSSVASPKTFGNCELNTPSKGPNTRIGLRSKPARVLKSNMSNSSFDSSPSSLMRSNFSSTNNPLSSPIRTNSPVRANINLSPVRTNINYSPVRTSINHSPVRTNINYSPVRKSSNLLSMTPSRLSTASNASSITLSVSSLTKTFYDEPMAPHATDQLKNDYKDITVKSPLKMKTKFSEGTASPLRKAVGILQLEAEEDPPLPQNSKKRLTDESSERTEPKKHRQAVRIDAELEDIKKLLSQHNNRIRPHTNNKKKS